MQSPTAPGWYDDPDDPEQLRYFDGIVWSERRVPKRVERRAPEQPAAPSAPAGGTDVYGRPTGAQGQPGHGQPPQAGSTSGQAGSPGLPGSAPGQPGHPGQGGPLQYYVPGQQPHAPAQAGGTEATTADGQPLASYGLRIAAYLLDGLVVGLLNLLLGGWALFLAMRDYIDFVLEAATNNDPQALEGLTVEEVMGFYDWGWYVAYLGISLVIFALYHSLMVGLKGGGVGKLAVGLRVRKVDTPGPPGVGAGFMRTLLPLAVALPLISWIALPVYVLDLIWPLRDAKRQAWHDKIAGTVVVQTRR